MLPVKSPPANVDAEASVLGACLIRPEIIPQVRAMVSPNDYYATKHERIASALYDLGDGATVLTVADKILKGSDFDGWDVVNYLSTLIEPGMSTGWRYHADLILETRRRRQIINAALVAAEQAYSGDLTETIAQLSDSLKIVEATATPVCSDNTKVLHAVVEKASRVRKLEGIYTGYASLDEQLGIIEPGTSCYLAARPSVGKTALAIAIIDNVLRENKRVLLFSLEMTSEAIMRRRLSAQSGVYLSRLRHGDVAESQWPDIIEAADILAKPTPIIVDNPAFKRVERLAAYSQAISREKPLGLIVVDHIQKMSTVRKSQSRHHELSYVSERLCDLAKECRCPVLVLCQLRRPPQESKTREPMLEDMKESGDLEQNADAVLGLHRDDKASTSMKVICLKNRDGAAGWTSYLNFDPPTQVFKDGSQPQVKPYVEREV